MPRCERHNLRYVGSVCPKCKMEEEASKRLIHSSNELKIQKIEEGTRLDSMGQRIIKEVSLDEVLSEVSRSLKPSITDEVFKPSTKIEPITTEVIPSAEKSRLDKVLRALDRLENFYLLEKISKRAYLELKIEYQEELLKLQQQGL